MTDFIVNAEARSDTGTNANRRMRHAGQIPAVVYGAGKDNQNMVLEHDGFMHQLEVEAFQTSILELKCGGKSEQVILREVQMHPHKPIVMHVDFQRVKASERIHMMVPFHFVGDEEAPGIKVGGGILSHMMNEVDISCLPKDLPEFIEVDVSALELNESVHLSDIKVPEGIEITSLAHEGGDHTVAAILPPQKEVAEGEEGEEGVEEGEGAAE